MTVSGTGFAPGVVAAIAVSSYNVRLTNPDGGTSICSGCFTVVSAPAPTSMTPAAELSTTG